MRINRPSGQPVPGGIDSASEAGVTDATDAAGEAAATEETAEAASEAVTDVPRVATEIAPGLTQEIGRALDAGRIGADAALAQVVDVVLDRQLGAGAPDGLRGRLQATLSEIITTDPVLAARVARLSE